MIFRKQKRHIDLTFSVIFLSCRHCFERPPPGSDFYALPLPWGALQQRADACPAWRVMSIAPAGSSSNSVHKKSGQAAHPQLEEELGAGKGGGGVLNPSYQTLFLCLSFFYSLATYLSLSSPKCFFSYHLLNRAQSIAISLSVSHTLHDMWWRGSPVITIWVLKHLSLLHGVVFPSLRFKVTAATDLFAV